MGNRFFSLNRRETCCLLFGGNGKRWTVVFAFPPGIPAGLHGHSDAYVRFFRFTGTSGWPKQYRSHAHCLDRLCLGCHPFSDSLPAYTSPMRDRGAGYHSPVVRMDFPCPVFRHHHEHHSACGGRPRQRSGSGIEKVVFYARYFDFNKLINEKNKIGEVTTEP